MRPPRGSRGRRLVVDVDGVGQVEDLRRSGGAEAMRMPSTGRIEYLPTFGSLVGGQTEVDVGGRVKSNTGVAMLVVVPVCELDHELPCLAE